MVSVRRIAFRFDVRLLRQPQGWSKPERHYVGPAERLPKRARKILAMRRHFSAGFGAAPACFRTALHMSIVLELPAIFGALSANLGAHSAGTCMQ